MDNFIQFGILLVQTVTLFFIARYTRETSRSIVTQSYFQAINAINSEHNGRQVSELKRILKKSLPRGNPYSIRRVKTLCDDITNRYQIVAHLVERDFLDKALFLENFSGTTMNVWNICAPFVSGKRRANEKRIQLTYLRHDLERLALQSWLYQYRLGYRSEIALLDSFGVFSILPPTDETSKKVVVRVKELKRPPLGKVKQMIR